MTHGPLVQLALQPVQLGDAAAGRVAGVDDPVLRHRQTAGGRAGHRLHGRRDDLRQRLLEIPDAAPVQEGPGCSAQSDDELISLPRVHRAVPHLCGRDERRGGNRTTCRTAGLVTRAPTTRPGRGTGDRRRGETWQAPASPAPRSTKRPSARPRRRYFTGTACDVLGHRTWVRFPSGTRHASNRLSRQAPTSCGCGRSSAAGPSFVSSDRSFRIGATVCGTAPAAPIALTHSVSGQVVTLQWAAGSGGGAPITYALEAGSAPGLTNIYNQPTGGLGTSLSASAPNGTYFVRVRAVNNCGQSPPTADRLVVVGEEPGGGGGPGGGTGGGGGGTNPPPPCIYALSPTNETVSPNGAGFSVQVSAGGSCSWRVVSNAGWVSPNGSTQGTGNGSVGFTVASNSGLARSAQITLEGSSGERRVMNVSQDGVPPAAACDYRLSSNSGSYGSDGGLFSVSLSAQSSCSWRVRSTEAWIIVSGSSRSGPGSIEFTIKENSGLGEGAQLSSQVATQNM